MKNIFFFTLFLSSCLLKAQTFQTGTTTVTFNDAGRTGGFGSGGGAGRQIQTEIYYPATAAGSNVAVASGTFPVVVIGHGFVMTWDSYDNIYSSLSKQGYIVALPRTEGGASPSHTDFGLDEALVANKVMQLNTTNTLAPQFVGKVAQKSAIGGHSMGGGSSFLGASNNGSIACLFNFAAAQTNPRSSQAAKTVTVPTLIIGGEMDCVAPAAANQNTMWDSTASTKKYAVIIKKLTHCDFGNGSNFNCTTGQTISGCGNTINNATALKLYMNFLNPFLAANLKGDCVEATRFMDSVNLSGVIFSKKILGSLACTSTDIKANESNNDLVSVYPNPAKTNISIHLQTNTGGINKIKVINALGQIQMNKLVEENQMDINISELKNGLYFIKFYNDDKLIAFRKLVKE